MTYEEFIESKRHRGEDYGIEPNYYPDKLFEYQRHVCEFAIRKGRCAVFLDTGLGKTIIQLTIAVNYHQYTGKPVLIITPLAVAFQFIKEAQKFGIEDISYSKDGKHDTRIVVCNYERLDKFNTADFDCAVDVGIDLRKRKAAFGARLFFAAQLKLRIEEHHRHESPVVHLFARDPHQAGPVLHLRNINHCDLEGHTHLLRSQTDAIG